MKQGVDLQTLAAELVRQAETKKDYIVDTRAVAMELRHTEENIARPILRLRGNPQAGDPSGQDLSINDITHRQIAERLDIPIKYYRLMMEHDPDLLTTNVNRWFNLKPQRRMLRTLDGKARAFLSDSYRTLDNLDVAEAVLPAIQASGAEVISCNVSDTYLYIKAMLPGRQIEITPPEAKNPDGSIAWGKGHHTVRIIKPAIIVGNSEVGLKALTFAPGTVEEACTNLAFFSRHGMRTIHVGGKAQGEADVWEFLKDDTKKLADAAVMRKLADLVEATLTGNLFDTIAAQLTDARQDALPPANLEATIDEVTKRFTFSADERNSVLAHLVQGGELNRYGLHNAITRASQDIADYDRATELERIGGEIIELTRNDWKAIAA